MAVREKKSELSNFIPSSTWIGIKEGYYFGTTKENGTGYYRDDRAGNGATPSIPNESTSSKRKQRSTLTVTFDETQNQIQSIPSRKQQKVQQQNSLEMEGEYLLAQAEKEHSDEKVLDLTPRGIQSAIATLNKLYNINSMQRVQSEQQEINQMSNLSPSLKTKNVTSTSTDQLFQSEMALYQHLELFSSVSTQPQLYTYWDCWTLSTELLSHINSDISLALIHVWVEWLDPSVLEMNDGNNADDESMLLQDAQAYFATRMVQCDSLVELLVANLGRLLQMEATDSTKPLDDDIRRHEEKGVEDILTCIERLIELVDETLIVEILAKDTRLVSWLVAQLPNQHGRSAELLLLLVQQRLLHSYIENWTQLPLYTSNLIDHDDKIEREENVTKASTATLDGLEVMLQALSPYRKQQPKTEDNMDFLENIVLVLSSLLVFATSTGSSSHKDDKNSHLSPFWKSFLDAQGPELILRAWKERVHLGGVGIQLWDIRHPQACEHLVTSVGILKPLLALLMGRAVPQPATVGQQSQALTPKAKRTWYANIERHVLNILYNLSRFLKEESPEDAKQRLLVQLVQPNTLDRLVDLLLHYDMKVRKAEYKYMYNHRHPEDGIDDDDDDDEKEPYDHAEFMAIKLASGGDLFHRVGAICAFICAHSQKAHSHIQKQLALQQSGIGLVQVAVQEFISILDDNDDVDDDSAKQNHHSPSVIDGEKRTPKQLLQSYLETL
jgi:hypothetical protein